MKDIVIKISNKYISITNKYVAALRHEKSSKSKDVKFFVNEKNALFDMIL